MKSILTSYRRTLLFLALLITPLLTACEEEGTDLFLDMAVEWASSKKLVSCTPEGSADCELSINYIEAGIYTAGYGTDPNVQAMFDTGKSVSAMNDADALAQEALETGNADFYADAIDKRPNDWSYREQLAAHHLAKGQQQDASAVQNDSENLVNDHISATLNAEGLSASDAEARKVCVSTHSNMLQHREAAILAQLDRMESHDTPEAQNLIAQLDLLQNSHMPRLGTGSASDPCARYGGG